jgi:hypothetical protein
MPSPDALGVVGPRPGRSDAIDWSWTRQRLHDLGAEGFQLERQGTAGYRFRCWLTRSGGPLPVEGTGPTEADAVLDCLARAGRLAGVR